MSFGTHVFISYAHDDNVNLTGDGKGWVDLFHKKLTTFLKGPMRNTPLEIFLDNKRLSDNAVFDPVIMERLPDSAVMVAVVTESYVLSPWCRREANAFCEAAEKSIGLAPGNQSRLFKVIKQPAEIGDALPSPMRDTLGSRFFVRLDKNERESDDDNDKPVPLEPGFGPAFEQKLNLRVCMLAQDIARTIQAAAAAANGAAPGTDAVASRGAAAVAAPAAARPATPKPVVYLALCGDDRSDDREALRSELVAAGYEVLPQTNPPLTEGAFQAGVRQLMERAALSVHLLGASSGVTPADGDDSIVAIQNALAVERESAGALRRVVWLPAGTVAKKAAHQTFLQNMAAIDAVHGKAELITGDFGKLKLVTKDALEGIERAAAAAPPAVADESGLPSIYVIFDRPDLAASKELRRALAAQWRVLKPLFDGEPDTLREDNMQRLGECDAVLVFYGSGTDSWKRAVDSDLLRARALRHGRPFRTVITWLTGTATADKEDLRGDAGVIDALAGFTPELLAPMLQAATQAPPGPRHG